MVIPCKCKRIEDDASESVRHTSNQGQQQHFQISKGEEPPTSTKDRAMGRKRHSQRLAIIVTQTQKTVEMNEADAPTWLAMEVVLKEWSRT